VARAIVIASSLQVVSDLEPGPDRDLLFSRCRDSAIGMLGGGVGAEPWSDPVGADSPTGPLRALTQRLTERDHYQLASHILDSLYLLTEPDSLERGRVLMHLATQAGLAGDGELLFERAKTLLALGRQLASDELLTKGWFQLNGYRHLRGNIPAWSVAVRRCMKYAERLGDPRLMSIALNCRMAILGQHGDLAGAIADGWHGFEICDHPEVRTRLLTNLGQAFYLSGHYRAARAARAILLESPLESSVQLTILGGYAEACAALADRAGVEWATSQALATAVKGDRVARGIAQGLMECAHACEVVHLERLAHETFARAMQIAESRGYHDLRFRTEPKARPVTRDAARPFSGSAELARQSILDRAPRGVPLTMTLAEA
jgi:hypothetical protein